MSEQSNTTPGASLGPQANGPDGAAPAEANKVGPGRPPVDKRWKKGGPSPNPRGRPRKDQSMFPDVRKAFEQALNKKVAVPRGDKKVLMTRVEIGLEQLLNQFAKGDRHARRALMEYADKLGIDFLAQHGRELEAALTPNYQAVVDAFLARRSAAGNVAPADPVLAPPDLLDDGPADPASSEPSDSEATTVSRAKPAPAPEPEPPPKPGMKYPKPFRLMTRSEKQAWYPEWYAKKLEEEQEKARAEEKAKAQANEKQAAQKLDQASHGPGRPASGGFSLTTGKWS
jgi:hypothetical protein